MAKPAVDSIPSFYQNYVNLVDHDDLIQGMIIEANQTIDLLKSIPEKSGDYSYGHEKWTIKEVITHILDAERVFAYRALTFARNDKVSLPGFEQNEWVSESNAGSRKLYKLIDEYNNVRAATIDLFSSFSDEMLRRTGTASGQTISVLGIGFIILGHEIHHRNILHDRYFS